jgi:serine/threonine protein kinase
MIVLLIESGADKGLQVEVESGASLVCGRKRETDLHINDPMASSKHFRVTETGGSLTLEDLGSTNGTFVNDERVTMREVKPGDVIRAGDTFISVLCDDGNGAQFSDTGLSITAAGNTSGKKEIAGNVLEERVGVGGMGVVYRARQLSLDREVAVKILNSKLTKDPELVKRFLDEARAAGRLTHSNVVQVHDVGEENGTYYISMEFINGGNLTDLLREQGRLAPETAVSIATDVARALQYAESKNIVHCDIKPDNIMITEGGMAKVADLGIARFIEEETGGSAEVMGSPHYMPPEQAQGKPVDRRSDIYALGCTLFRMVAGRTPFSGTTSREIMKKQVFETPPDIRRIAPEVGENLAQIVEKMMKKEPAQRFQSASELLEAFAKINIDQPVFAQPEPRKVTSAPPPSPRKPIPAKAPVKAQPEAMEKIPELRTSHRARRGQGVSSTASFAPLALVGLFFVPAVFALLYYMNGDSGVDTLRKATRLYEDGQYQEAKELLELKGRSKDLQISKQLQELRVKVDMELRGKQADTRFNQLWAQYRSLKSEGASQSVLVSKLEELKLQYGHNPERARLIDGELSSVK